MYSGIKALLHQSQGQLKQGNYDQALAKADAALQRDPTPEERDAALRLKAEAYLQNALSQISSYLRLQQIDAALELTPNAPRLRLYRGWALWQASRYAEALVEFDAVAVQKPEWPSIAYLCQLGRLATGCPWGTDDLSQVEANTLHLVQNLIQEGSAAQSRRLLDEPLLGKMPQFWQTLVEIENGAAFTSVPPPAKSDHSAGDRTANIIKRYYQGVAAILAGDLDAAHTAWLTAYKNGLNTPWLTENLSALQRKQAIEWAKQEQWQAIADIARETPKRLEQDRIWAETVALAHNHLGYKAAEAERWEEAAEHWSRAMNYAASRQLAQNLALAAEAQEEWEQAAEAWRDMVRRRPRKPSHPDYLDDGQVAELWRHTATCYLNDGDIDEAITCLKHASKYAGDDVDIRLALAETLLANDQWEAAGNELNRILAIDPDNAEALKHQALLLSADRRWYHDTTSHWKHILALEPDNIEVKDALALAYVEKQQRMWYSSKDSIAYLEQALADLPEHPALLLALAQTYEQADGEEDKSIATLLRAYHADPTDTKVGGTILHQLLHFEDEGIENTEPALEELILGLRKIETLLPTFWLNQLEELLDCELGSHWIERFIDEALNLVERPYVRDTRASILVKTCELLRESGERARIDTCLDAIRKQTPESGAVQYVLAMLAIMDHHDTRKARRLLKTARRLARRTHDSELVVMIEHATAKLDAGLGGMPDNLLMRLMELFPDGPPSPEMMDELFDDEFYD